MHTRIATQYEFCSAHYLPHVPDTHKCKRLHGHNYVLQVICEGETRPDGMLIDFFEIDEIVKPWVEKVDHRCLNEIEGLENPTAEHIADWFLHKVCNKIPHLVTCRVFETPTCFAEVAESPPFVTET